MKHYTDLDGRQHFIDARPTKATIERYIPLPIQKLLKFGITMTDLTNECINFVSNNGVNKESMACSMYNRWFKMGLIYWGDENKIYLSNW